MEGTFIGGICKYPSAIKPFIGKHVCADIHGRQFRISEVMDGGFLLFMEGELREREFVLTENGRQVCNLLTKGGSVYKIALN